MVGMISGSLAKRYARALLEAAKDGAERDRFLADLEALDRVAKTHVPAPDPSLLTALQAAHIPMPRRLRIARGICARLSTDPIVTELFVLMVGRGRVGGLTLVARHYRDLADDAASRVRATVTTPTPLDADVRARLERVIREVTGKTVVLEAAVDPELIGGMVTRIGSYTIDGSVRSSLSSLRRTLKRN